MKINLLKIDVNSAFRAGVGQAISVIVDGSEMAKCTYASVDKGLVKVFSGNVIGDEVEIVDVHGCVDICLDTDLIENVRIKNAIELVIKEHI